MDKIFRHISLFFLYFYKFFISGYVGNGCRFLPTCSSYAEEAFRKKRFFSAIKLTLIRLGRCHPFGGCGYDPIPDNDFKKVRVNEPGQ